MNTRWSFKDRRNRKGRGSSKKSINRRKKLRNSGRKKQKGSKRRN